jgi:hypothetical protein
MTKDDRDESLPLNPLLGERSLALADASTRRGLEKLTGEALERCGVTSQVSKAIERGLSPEQAIEKVLPKARGIVAEETVAAVFNREAGLVSSSLTASRFELPNDPFRDLVVRDTGGNTVQACQLKFGKEEYVQRAALSGKYSGPIVTSQEVAEALDGRLPANAVTPTLKAGMITTQPVTDAEVTATARRVLERRFRRIESLSSWHAFGRSLKESAPAGIGAAVLTASHEVYQAISTQQQVKVDRVFRTSLKAGARAMLVDQIGRLTMQLLEQRILQAGGWTQAAIKKAAGWATPASALSTLLVDVAMSYWQLLRGRITGQEFMQRLLGHVGAAVVGALGVWAGYWLGSHVHPVVAVLLAMAGGAFGAYHGERLGVAAFNLLVEAVPTKDAPVAGTT